MATSSYCIDAWRQAHQRLTLAIAQSHENISAELAKRRFLLEEIGRCKIQPTSESKKKAPQKKTTSGAKAKKVAISASSVKSNNAKYKKQTKSSGTGDKAKNSAESSPVDAKRKIKLKVKKPSQMKAEFEKAQSGKRMAAMDSSSEDIDEDDEEDEEVKGFNLKNMSSSEESDESSDDDREGDDRDGDDREGDDGDDNSDGGSEGSPRESTDNTTHSGKHDSMSPRNSDASMQQMGYHPHQINPMLYQTAYGVMPGSNFYPPGYGMVQNMAYGMPQMAMGTQQMQQHFSHSDHQPDSDEVESDDEELEW